jgi:hypothetical protein
MSALLLCGRGHAADPGILVAERIFHELAEGERPDTQQVPVEIENSGERLD